MQLKPSIGRRSGQVSVAGGVVGVPASTLVVGGGGGVSGVPASSSSNASQDHLPLMHAHSSCRNSHSVPSGTLHGLACMGIVGGQFGSTGSAQLHLPPGQPHSISS
jgi:hypothetical protein